MADKRTNAPRERKKNSVRPDARGANSSELLKSSSAYPIERLIESERPEQRSSRSDSRPNGALGDFGLGKLKEFLGRENQVAKFFLSVFILLLVFFIGTGVGKSRNISVIDGAINEILANSPSAIDRGTLERAAIEGALRASGDEWANYFPTTTLSELNRVTSNVMAGAGITITKSRSGALSIADIETSSPADEAGLQVGDQIVSVNDSNVQGEPATKVAAMIRAKTGTVISIAVARGAQIIEVSLRTKPVEFKTVEGSQIADGVAYLAISSFATGTSTELIRQLGELDSSRGVLIDLRDNPGGLLREMVKVAEQFISRGVIVSYKVNGEERVFTARNYQPNKSPVVLMINRGTSSSAEILAAAFQERNRGVVIGERSYGKGSVQEFVTLSDGSRLELTVALYLTPLGRTIEGIGVSPDLDVRDSELATKALQILGGLAQLGNEDSAKSS